MHPRSDAALRRRAIGGLGRAIFMALVRSPSAPCWRRETLTQFALIPAKPDAVKVCALANARVGRVSMDAVRRRGRRRPPKATNAIDNARSVEGSGSGRAEYSRAHRERGQVAGRDRSRLVFHRRQRVHG